LGRRSSRPLLKYTTVNVLFAFWVLRIQEFQLKMEGLKQRREELETKELDLRRSLEKFNTFLTVSKLRRILQTTFSNQVETHKA